MMRLLLATIILTTLAPPLLADEDKVFGTPLSLVIRQKCPTMSQRYEEIFDACYIAKLPEATGLISELQRKFERHAKEYCERVACNPGLLDRLRY